MLTVRVLFRLEIHINVSILYIIIQISKVVAILYHEQIKHKYPVKSQLILFCLLLTPKHIRSGFLYNGFRGLASSKIECLLIFVKPIWYIERYGHSIGGQNKSYENEYSHMSLNTASVFHFNKMINCYWPGDAYMIRHSRFTLTEMSAYCNWIYQKTQADIKQTASCKTPWNVS